MPSWTDRDTKRARELRNAATPAERELWRHLARSQLGVRFSRQMPVGPFFADFLCRSHKLIVELDGHSHDVQPERDEARDAYLRSEGYRVLHFSNADVIANTEGVIDTICVALQEEPTPGPSRKREGRQ
ncbi:endonuclease domain-containing protein [Citromicrobium bathyomarinum]|uniref:endonuclease domain-containing protein n=1 Tax=Citromicrobium bathyomarinum TaxID=72174 RepID=UPI003159F0A5